MVRDNLGKKWDLRESLVAGKTLGNQLTGEFDKAVWWVCSGDAEKFDPKAIAPSPMPTYTSPDGRGIFQGQSGAIRQRGGKATLTLGTTGRIKFRGTELAADGPATKELK